MNVMIQKSLPSKGFYQKTQVPGFFSTFLRDFITNLSYLRISFFLGYFIFQSHGLHLL